MTVSSSTTTSTSTPTIEDWLKASTTNNNNSNKTLASITNEKADHDEQEEGGSSTTANPTLRGTTSDCEKSSKEGQQIEGRNQRVPIQVGDKSVSSSRSNPSAPRKSSSSSNLALQLQPKSVDNNDTTDCSDVMCSSTPHGDHHPPLQESQHQSQPPIHRNGPQTVPSSVDDIEPQEGNNNVPPNPLLNNPDVPQNQIPRVQALEERVHDLETKLLVLSRLIQIQGPSSLARNGQGSKMELVSSLDKTDLPSFSQQSFVRGGRGRRNLAPRKEALPPSLETRASAETRHINNTTAGGNDGSGRVTPTEQMENSIAMGQCTEENNAAFPLLESPAIILGMDDNSSADSSYFLGGEKLKESAGEQPLGTVQTQGNVVVGSQENRTHVSNIIFKEPEKTKSSFNNTEIKKSKPVSSLRPRRMTSAQRNLSFKILYGGDEKTYEQESRADPNATLSMTPSERTWLGASMLLHEENEATESKKSNEGNHERNNSGGGGGENDRNNINSDDLVRNKWLNYLNSFQESTHDVDVQMQEFVKVPGYVESIMTFGFFISVDSFLYIFTILPIRFVWSSLLLVLRVLSFWTKKPSPPYQFHRRHSYQMIQVFLLYVIYQYVLVPISIGKLYHWIRGQAMIKLYVLISIVDVFDRLLCSLGQDCLDSMYWNAVNRPKSSRMLISVAVVLVYEACHTLLLFLHVATLNVAMNSADIALLTLFISGNFAEIKSSVFKKYNKPALFKMTAADICERFKLGLFLGLVLLLNMCQGMDQGQFMAYVRVCAIVWCAELFADWVKHSFVTKFNILPAKVYVEYSLLLAGDFTGIGHEGVNLDHSHAVVKRIGFAQLPLVCVTLRFLREAAKYASINEFWPSFPAISISSLVVAWVSLLAVKLALGTMLQRISWSKVQSAPEILPPSCSPSKKKR